MDVEHHLVAVAGHCHENRQRREERRKKEPVERGGNEKARARERDRQTERGRERERQRESVGRKLRERQDGYLFWLVLAVGAMSGVRTYRLLFLGRCKLLSGVWGERETDRQRERDRQTERVCEEQ